MLKASSLVTRATKSDKAVVIPVLAEGVGGPGGVTVADPVPVAPLPVPVDPPIPSDAAVPPVPIGTVEGAVPAVAPHDTPLLPPPPDPLGAKPRPAKGVEPPEGLGAAVVPDLPC